jgi:hypothetical protein
VRRLSMAAADRLRGSWAQTVRTAKRRRLEKLEQASQQMSTLGLTMQAFLNITRNVNDEQWRIFVADGRISASVTKDKTVTVVDPDLAIKAMR